MQLPKTLYVCLRDPDDLSKGYAVSANASDLFDRKFSGQQLVTVYNLERQQELVLVPEQVVLKDVAGEAG